MDKVFDLQKYAAKAREMMAEGIVMLRNENQALPLAEGSRVALFGRSQYNYYKSGTGSGGLVNTSYVTGVKEAIEGSGIYELNGGLKKRYDAWIQDHPYDAGQGWGNEPWFQEEMPITPEIAAEAAADSEAAIVLIGRTAGEDKDNGPDPGSYFLTDAEKEMLANVTAAFSRTIVLLNVGNIIDMSWVDAYRPAAVLYIWQGGQEGGNGVIDVLSGAVSPSGRLSDTIAKAVEDYPAYGHYGDPDENIYAEDIYVGYRYFETFAPEKVQYPFGFGLSYTTFSLETEEANIEEMMTPDAYADEAAQAEADGYEGNEAINFGNVLRIDTTIAVTNTGDFPGKEVVQLYVKAPQGLLGKPAVSLVGYGKTKNLEPGETEHLAISFEPYNFASYDDAGVTGHKSCYVLEAGTYEFYVGTSCRDLTFAFELEVPETYVLQQLSEALAPDKAFDRLTPEAKEDGAVYTAARKPVPTRTASRREKRAADLPEDIPYTGDKGYKLQDLAEGRVHFEDFIAQISDADLCAITRGEGMSSPKVTPGTGGAFAGVTDGLLALGIPTMCCSDGPSGIRMDCGTTAFAMPNGTSMACSFNDELVEEMYRFEGLELRKDRIDCLLGPGMNLHRYPMNGRNFEYFSEDPLLTGKMAAAQLRGMHKYGVTGVIKHFAFNDQEFRRNFVNGVVSERAARELYLKGFEIAVKEGGADAVMSTYGPVNGQYTAGNYDLLTQILRQEWGFDGIVMTDWWTQVNDIEAEGESAPNRGNTAAMVRAQNDLYMVVENAAKNSKGDNTEKALAEGKITRGELQRNAANICAFCIGKPAYLRMIGQPSELDLALEAEEKEADTSYLNVIPVLYDLECELPTDRIATGKGRKTTLQIGGSRGGITTMTFEARVVADSVLSQVSMSLFQDNALVKTLTLSGEDSEWKEYAIELNPSFQANFFLQFFFSQGGMELRNMKLTMDVKKSDEFLAMVAKFMSGGEQ